MKAVQKFFSMFFATLVVWFGSANLLLAQVTPVRVHDGGGELVDWVEGILIWAIGIAGLVAAAVLIYNGFMYITAQGDEGKIQKATKGITYAIIGLIIAAIAFLIVNYIIQVIEESASIQDNETKIELVA